MQQQIHNHLNNFNIIQQNIYNVHNKISIKIEYQNDNNVPNLPNLPNFRPKNQLEDKKYENNGNVVNHNFHKVQQVQPKNYENRDKQNKHLPRIQEIPPEDYNNYNSLDDLNAADENYQFYNEKAVDVPENFEKESYLVMGMQSKANNFKRRICPPRREISPKNGKVKKEEIVYVKVSRFYKFF